MAGALDYLTVPSPRSYGPPLIDFSPVGNLVKNYQEGQQYGYQRNLQTMFQPGTPGYAALQSGNYSALLPLIAAGQGASGVQQLLPALMQGQKSQQLMQGEGGDQQSALPQSQQPTGGNDVGSLLKNSIYGQESGYGRNTRTSATGNVGPMQISRSLFAENALPGERIDDPVANKAVGDRILDKYLAKYGGDWRRAAVAYYSGEGNVAPPGSSTPWKVDRSPRPGVPGPSTSGYVAQVGQKMAGLAGASRQATATPQSDQLNPADRAAVDSMYPPGGTAAVGTAPVSTPAVEQPPGGDISKAPFMGGANVQQQQEPTQVAQAQPVAQQPAQQTTDPEVAMRTQRAANFRFQQHEQELKAKIAAQPPYPNKEQSDKFQAAADKLAGQAQKDEDFIADRQKEQYSVGIAGQKEEQTAYQKKYETLGQSAVEATKELQKSGVAKNIMSDPSYISGFGAGRTLNFQRAVAAFDPSQANVAQPQEVMKKFFSDSLRSKIVALSQSGVGRVMRSEVAIMEKANANQENSIASNRTLVEMDERANKMINGLADAADQYADAHNGHLDHGWEAEARKYIKANPMFTDKETEDSRFLAAPQMPTRFKTRAEVDDWARKMQLQPGEPVRLPNGKYQFWKG